MSRRATSRFKTERPLPDDRQLCVVAFIGFRLATIAKGLLERCELRPLEFAHLEEARRVLETLAVDAVVFDAHHAQLKRPSPALSRVVELISLTDTERQQPAVVVISAAGVSPEVAQQLRDLGAIFVRHPHQHYRRLATVVRSACGLADRCCE